MTKPILVILGESKYRMPPFYADSLELYNPDTKRTAWIELERQDILTRPDESGRFKGIYKVKKIWDESGEDWTTQFHQVQSYRPKSFTICTVKPDCPENTEFWEYETLRNTVDSEFPSVILSQGIDTISLYQPTFFSANSAY